MLTCLTGHVAHLGRDTASVISHDRCGDTAQLVDQALALALAVKVASHPVCEVMQLPDQLFKQPDTNLHKCYLSILLLALAHCCCTKGSHSFSSLAATNHW